jgi:hypothetical protein
MQNDTKTERAKKQEKNSQKPNHNRKPNKTQQKPAQKPSAILHHSNALLLLPRVEPRLLAS